MDNPYYLCKIAKTSPAVYLFALSAIILLGIASCFSCHKTSPQAHTEMPQPPHPESLQFLTTTESTINGGFNPTIIHHPAPTQPHKPNPSRTFHPKAPTHTPPVIKPTTHTTPPSTQAPKTTTAPTGEHPTAHNGHTGKSGDKGYNSLGYNPCGYTSQDLSAAGLPNLAYTQDLGSTPASPPENPEAIISECEYSDKSLSPQWELLILKVALGNRLDDFEWLGAQPGSYAQHNVAINGVPSDIYITNGRINIGSYVSYVQEKTLKLHNSSQIQATMCLISVPYGLTFQFNHWAGAGSTSPHALCSRLANFLRQKVFQ